MKPPDARIRRSGTVSPSPSQILSDLNHSSINGERRGGRSLALVRIAWIIVAASALCFFVAGIPPEFGMFHTVCQHACEGGQVSPAGLRALRDLGLSLDFYAAYAVALDIVFATLYAAVAVIIFWQRSGERMALLASFALFTFGTAGLPNTMNALTIEHTSLWWPVSLLNFLGAASFGLFIYRFPDGRFVPGWSRWVVFAWIAWQLPKYWYPSWNSNDFNSWPSWLAIPMWTAFLGTMVYAQSYRYRRVSSATERQQVKWVVFGISVAALAFLSIAVAFATFAPAPTTPRTMAFVLVGYTFLYTAMLLIPLSVGFAILRHQLFDIDLIINRTLVYGSLTAGIVGLYVLVVGSVGVILQVQGNLLLSILAAGLVAVLFQPLRERLQRAVNHLMYGKRDDPYTVLSQLGQRLEARLAPDAVLPAVVLTVQEALKLPYAEIQLKRGEGFETAASTGEPVAAALRLPLVYGGETVGRLVLGPRAGEGGFADAERRLLEDLAHQIGASAHAALKTDEAERLAADLQRSRERLVEAREEERRRLRRDLHDGLGPQLSSQTLTVDAVRALMRRDPDAAEALLLDLKADAQEAVADIRRLVYGLRPPALDDLGLLGALHASAAQYGAKGLGVSVDSPQKLPKLSAAVEVAAYRIAQEALANVARHAGANTCVVSLATTGSSTLRLEVRDDGRGIPDPRESSIVRSGVGLTSMRERAGELGGSLVVEPLREGGTLVRATLPLPEEE